MNAFLDWAHDLPLLAAAGWLLLANLVSFALALLAGDLAAALFASRRGVPPPGPIGQKEVVYAAAGIAVNWLVTVLAWLLWRDGVILIRRDTGWRAWLDVPVLVLGMDLAMYLLHRVVHLPWFYPIHRLHHE